MSKTVLITGCSSGFGKLTSQTLAKEGYEVYASMRDANGKNKESKTELESWAKDNNVDLKVIDLDVTSESSCNKAVAEVISKSKKIDVLLNNAGIGVMGYSESLTEDQFKQMFEVNVFGILRMMRAVLPYMKKENDGLIINTSSVIGRLVLPFLGIYVATKFAVEGITESYHYELKPMGVDCVMIEPGAYPGTSFNQNSKMGKDEKRLTDFKDLKEYNDKIFAGFGAFDAKAGEPQEIADTILEIVSMEQGKRPLRATKGFMSEYAHKINTKCAEVQSELFQNLGINI